MLLMSEMDPQVAIIKYYYYYIINYLQVAISYYYIIIYLSSGRYFLLCVEFDA